MVCCVTDTMTYGSVKDNLTIGVLLVYYYIYIY